MSKVLALDLGDVWTGVALSDEIGLLARPYKSVKTAQLEAFLTEVLTDEPIKTVVVGYPRTLRGTASEQTRKIEQFKKELEQKFDTVKWILWDERLTSKMAQTIQKKGARGSKHDEHSLAAAFILDSYLEYCRVHRSH